MLLLIALMAPLLAAVLIPAAGLFHPSRAHRMRRVTAMMAPLTTVPAVALSMFGAESTLEIPWLLFGSHLQVDAIARPLLLIAALLYGAAMMAVTWLKLRDTQRGSGAVTAFLLVSFVGNIGCYLAADAVTFYTMFALMSFSAAGLVVHHRSQHSHRATRIYLVMSVFSETALLAGLLLVVHAGGFMLSQVPEALAASEVSGLAVTLLLIGFGVKAGTIPLHIWLPLAHPAAPPPASAVLSGAMVKAGLVGWLRFLPLEDHSVTDSNLLGWVLLVLALVGAFAAVALGAVQTDPKVVLAYSTISQMGFIAVVVAAGLLDPEVGSLVAPAAVVYAVHHGLAKGALFLGVPVVHHYGRGTTGIIVLIGMALSGLAVAGAPLTSGAFGKYVSKDAVAPLALFGIGLDDILPLVATGSTLLLIRFAWLLWNSERQPKRAADGELVSWLLVAAAGIVVPWLIGDRWTPVSVPEWSPDVVWNAVWPILLGLLAGGLIWFVSAKKAIQTNLPSVPPGDIVVAEERIVTALLKAVGAGTTRITARNAGLAQWWSRSWDGVGTAARATTARLDRVLANWSHTGAALLLLFTLVILALWLLGGFAS